MLLLEVLLCERTVWSWVLMLVLSEGSMCEEEI